MFIFLKNLPKKCKLMSVLGLLILSSDILAYEILPFKDKVSEDYKNFYKFDRFARIAGVGAVAGTVANTSMDREIYDWYQEDIRSDRTDSISKMVKYAGEGKYLLPLSLIVSQTVNFDMDSKLGAWGNDVARAYTLGLPFVWSTQYLTGASRPIDLDGSDWRPFKDNNGVSGHAFVGAIPFLAMARNTDNEYMRYFAYFASGLAAWSRVNDGAHYTSQSILGWYFAYEVMDAVQDTNSGNSNGLSYSVYPVIGGDTVGLGVQIDW
jgi:hypothetical protein